MMLGKRVTMIGVFLVYVCFRARISIHGCSVLYMIYVRKLKK